MAPRALIILFADLDAENAVTTLITKRSTDLQIKPIHFDPKQDAKRHTMRDSGCFLQSDAFLRSYFKSHEHAMVIFDRHGCGKDTWLPEKIESNVEHRLKNNGWPAERIACIVFDPGLEIWVWSESSTVSNAMGFGDDISLLNAFLQKERLLKPGEQKPTDPKAALKRCMRNARKPYSARLFSALAETVDFSKCQDRAFNKFKSCLQNWFG
jgi:hypothetical protein